MEWVGGLDGHVAMLDQTLLPSRMRVFPVSDVETMWRAIRRLAVRGAPAIGVAAAYGVVLGVRRLAGESPARFQGALERVTERLAGSRPTAVNLFWALLRMKALCTRLLDSGVPTLEVAERLLEEAQSIHAEDARQCESIGRHGESLLRDGFTVLTHCNAGALATGGIGTALAAVYAAAARGKRIHVFADETRPLLQGARLTSWELLRAGIEVTLICDGTAARVLGEKKINCAIVGADRIARNGDTANKIGTYGVALLSRAHGVPFYVAAPSTTFDPQIKSGNGIPIEERAAAEVSSGFGKATAPPGVGVYNPAFDVTPHKLVTAFITEKGIIRPPYGKNLRRVLGWR